MIEDATTRLLTALHSVLRKPDPTAFEEARAALKAFRATLVEAAPASASCSLCRDVPDSNFVRSRSSKPFSLPAACARIIPPDLVTASRGYGEFRCPECGMGYVYERGYEFLMCESEDEETLTRLHVPMLLDRIAARLKHGLNLDSPDLQACVRLLESGLRMA